jgi:hypothetical protein
MLMEPMMAFSGEAEPHHSGPTCFMLLMLKQGAAAWRTAFQ